jgi:ribosomal-protein-alanine N-acetyltransferase
MPETERTSLRPPTMSDLEDIRSLYCDPDIQTYIGGDPDIEVCARQLQKAILKYEEDGYGMMMIFQKEQGSFIGFCKIQSSPFESPKHIEIIYGLLPEWRRKGYAAEATKEVLSWAFNNIDIDQIIGCVKPDNDASRKLLEGLGFKRIEDRVVPITKEIENVFLLTNLVQRT